MEAAATAMTAGLFEYEGNFDTNGVLYCLGTNNKTEGYTNPHRTGKVVVTLSSLPAFGTVGGFIAHTNPAYNRLGESAPGSTVAVKLPVRLFLTKYTVRHGRSDGGCRLRSWVVEGSEDGTSGWVELREHIDDQSLADKGFSVASWDVDMPEPDEELEGPALYDYEDSLAFTHFRIRMTGRDSSGCYYLHLAGIELYGRVVGKNAVCANTPPAVECF